MIYHERDGACCVCGVRTGLLAVIRCVPLRPPYEGWTHWSRAHCVDRTKCWARRDKQLARSRTRAKMLVVAEPKMPDAPLGTCRWCGSELTGANGSRRNYCYPDREGRDCRGEAWRSRAWTARDALVARGDPVCVDCGSQKEWEADHDLALEDGGEHTLENLVRRCVDCHRRKTARENAARALARRPPPDTNQLELGVA